MSRTLIVSLAALLLVLSGCGRNMYDQPKYEFGEPSRLFADGMSARPEIEGTVPRDIGMLDNRYEDTSFYSGLGATGYVSELPVPLTEALLVRGQERYNIYCAPCHNYAGQGDGVVVQRGFVPPASFHEPRLRNMPSGYFVGAMYNGFGRMYSYASRIPAEDRWAIAAYIKTLQYSQFADEHALPEAELLRLHEELEAGGQQ